MKTLISFAQKAVVFNQNKVLTLKYSESSVGKKVIDRLALPGGQLEFGENPDESIVREVQEETGITITPLLPFYTWTWTYKIGKINKQIVAVARLCKYKSGKINSGSKKETESKIDEVSWSAVNSSNLNNFLEDERPIIEQLFKYSRENPFVKAHK